MLMIRILLWTKGFSKINIKVPPIKKNGHPSKVDFREFGKRIGVMGSRTEKIMGPFLEKQEKVETLINSSFLNKSCKKEYVLMYNTKRNYLNG